MTTQTVATRPMRFIAREEVDGSRLVLDIIEIDMPVDQTDAKAMARFHRIRNRTIKDLADRMIAGEICDYDTVIMPVQEI